MRDELAKAFAQNNNQQKTINQLTEDMKNLQAINTEMILKNQEQAGKLAFYENPHSPAFFEGEDEFFFVRPAFF